MSERTNPSRGFAVFLVIADIEIGSHPRAVDLINILYQFSGCLIVRAIVVVKETVPDIFDENMYSQLRCEWKSLSDLLN